MALIDTINKKIQSANSALYETPRYTAPVSAPSASNPVVTNTGTQYGAPKPPVVRYTAPKITPPPVTTTQPAPANGIGVTEPTANPVATGGTQTGTVTVTAPTTTPITRYTTPYDQAAADADAARKTTFTLDDEQAIREQKRKNAQAQIDAVNLIFQQKRTEQEAENVNRSGRTRSLLSSAGLSGSGRGTKQTEDTLKGNKELLASIDAERQAKLTAIEAGIEDLASAEIAARREEAKGNLDAHLNFLKNNVDKATQSIIDIGKSGKTLDDLDPKDIEDFMRWTGKSKLELDSLIETNLPAEFKTQWTNITAPDANGNAKLTKVGVNPRTGKTEKKEYDLGIPYSQIANLDVKEVDGILVGFDPVTKQVTNLTQPSEKSRLELENKRLQNAELRAKLGGTGGVDEAVLKTPQFQKAQAAQNLKSTLQKAINAVQKYGNKEKLDATGRGILDSLSVELRSKISTAQEQGVVQPGEAASFDKIAGNLNKSYFIRNAKTIASLSSLSDSADTILGQQKAALANTYKINDDQFNSLLGIVSTGNTTTAPDGTEVIIID